LLAEKVSELPQRNCVTAKKLPTSPAVSQVLITMPALNVWRLKRPPSKPATEVGRYPDALQQRILLISLIDYPARKGANESREGSFRRPHQDQPVVHGVLHARLLSRNRD
jgi:hypothetical protein